MIRASGRRGTDINAIAVSCIVLTAALVAMGGCAQQNGLRSSQGRIATATATGASIPTVDVQITRLAQQAGGAQEKSVTVTNQQEHVSVTANIAVTVPRSPSEISAAQELVKNLCFQIERTLWTSGISLQEVTVSIDGPTYDDYFDLITSWYGAASLTATVAAHFNWSSLSADQAWTTFGQTSLRQEFAPFEGWGLVLTTPTPTPDQ